MDQSSIHYEHSTQFHSRLEWVVLLVNLILMIPVVKITFNHLYYTTTDVSSRALGYPRARDEYCP